MSGLSRFVVQQCTEWSGSPSFNTGKFRSSSTELMRSKPFTFSNLKKMSSRILIKVSVIREIKKYKDNCLVELLTLNTPLKIYYYNALLQKLEI